MKKQQIIDKIKEAMAVLEDATCGGMDERVNKETCKWIYFENDYEEHWDSECGECWSFIDGGPKENRIKYCHGCGKLVEVIEQKEKECEQ